MSGPVPRPIGSRTAISTLTSGSPTSRWPIRRRLPWSCGRLEAGSKYPVALRDAKGEFLPGSNTYKLHLPPNPPAALFWAATAYNISDGTVVEAPQLMPSINGFNKVATNGDGSVDLWFAPENPRMSPNQMGSRPSADGTSWWRFVSTAPASSSPTMSFFENRSVQESYKGLTQPPRTPAPLSSTNRR
jgi:uncharacterized protein DUF1214